MFNVFSYHCVAGRCAVCVSCLAAGTVIIGLGLTPVKPVTAVAWRRTTNVCDVVVKTGRGRTAQAIHSCHGSRQSQTRKNGAHGCPTEMHGQVFVVMETLISSSFARNVSYSTLIEHLLH